MVKLVGLSLRHLAVLRADRKLSAPPRRRSNALREKYPEKALSVSQPTSVNSTIVPGLLYSEDRNIGRIGSASSTIRNIEFLRNVSMLDFLSYKNITCSEKTCFLHQICKLNFFSFYMFEIKYLHL